MEVGQVLLEHLGRVARRVASHKDRLDLLAVLVCCAQNVGEHLELLRAHVRAQREAEVQDRELAEQILVGELVAVEVHELEGPADQRLADALPLALLAADGQPLLLLVEEVREHAAADNHDQQAAPNRAHGHLVRSLAHARRVAANGHAAERFAGFAVGAAGAGRARRAGARWAARLLPQQRRARKRAHRHWRAQMAGARRRKPTKLAQFS